MKAAQGMFRVIGGAIKGTPSSTQRGRTMDDLTAQIEAYVLCVYCMCVFVCTDVGAAIMLIPHGIRGLLAYRPYSFKRRP